MTNRVRSVDQASYHGRRLLHDLGEELREARLRAGLRQVDIAQALGTSDTRLAVIEAVRLQTVSILDLMRHAAAVGLRLHARLYPAGPPIRDAAQVALLDKFRRRLSDAWEVRLEAPLPIQRDQRAWDMLLRDGSVTVGVEAISRLRDVQAQVRAAQLKRRDAGVQRLVLLVAATHANRRALASAEAVVRSEFKIGTRSALVALAGGRDPAADALVLL
jgi:transcriptional regulator with XRE-family HTH domain